MTRLWNYAIVLFGIGCIVLAPFVGPAQAQEQPKCELTADAFKAWLATKPDGDVLAFAEYEGENSDLTMIYVADGVVSVIGFNKGCYQGGPINIDRIVSPVTAPQPAPLSPAEKMRTDRRTVKGSRIGIARRTGTSPRGLGFAPRIFDMVMASLGMGASPAMSWAAPA